MASVDWQKIKSPQEAKAMFRHCIKSEREKRSHSNLQIDKNLTSKNVSFGAFDSYEKACDLYDEMIRKLDNTKPQKYINKKGKESTIRPNKRADRVTLFGWSIPAPQEFDEETTKEWANQVYRTLDKNYNLIGGELHLDEVHTYTDENGNEVQSRPHLHVYVVPVDWFENTDGEEFFRLNGRGFSSRAKMNQMNKTVDRISKKYGGTFLTGEKKKSTKSVESLKNESRIREVNKEAERIIKEAEKASQELTEANEKKAEELKKKEDDLEIKISNYKKDKEELKLEQDYQQRRANSLDTRESELDTREQNFIAQATANAQAERERILAEAEAEAEEKKEKYKKEVQDKERETIRKQEQARAEKKWKEWAREKVDKAIEEVNRKANSKWIMNGSGKVLHQYVQMAIRFRDKLLENLNNSPVVTQAMKDDLQYASDNVQTQQKIFDTAFDPIAVKQDDFDFDF